MTVKKSRLLQKLVEHVCASAGCFVILMATKEDQDGIAINLSVSHMAHCSESAARQCDDLLW